MWFALKVQRLGCEGEGPGFGGLGNPPPPSPEREGRSGDQSHVLITCVTLHSHVQ